MFPRITNPTLSCLLKPSNSSLLPNPQLLGPAFKALCLASALPSSLKLNSNPPSPTLHLTVYNADHPCAVSEDTEPCSAVPPWEILPASLPDAFTWLPRQAAFYPFLPGLQGVQAHLTSSLSNFKAIFSLPFQKSKLVLGTWSSQNGGVKYQSVPRF